MFERIFQNPKTSLCGIGISILQYVAVSHSPRFGIGTTILGLVAKDK